MSCDCEKKEKPCTGCPKCEPRKVKGGGQENACDIKWSSLDEECTLVAVLGLNDEGCVVELSPDSCGVMVQDKDGSRHVKCIPMSLLTEAVIHARDPETGDPLLNEGNKAIREPLKIPYIAGISNGALKYFQGPNDGVKRYFAWDGECFFCFETLPKMTELEVSGEVDEGRLLVMQCVDCKGEVKDERVYALNGSGIVFINDEGCVKFITCDTEADCCTPDCDKAELEAVLGCCNGQFGMFKMTSEDLDPNCRTRAPITPSEWTCIPENANMPVLQWNAYAEEGGGSPGGYVEIYCTSDPDEDPTGQVVWAEHTTGNYGGSTGIIKSGEFSVECGKCYRIVGTSVGRIVAHLLS